jgi:uncharacterized protein (UPF0548 family)
MLWLSLPVAAGLWWPPISFRACPPPADVLSGFAQRASQQAALCPLPGTIDNVPPRWFVNRSERCIGRGRAAFTRAAAELTSLNCLELGWLTHRVKDDVLAICSRQFGFVWMMNANRILDRRSTSALHSVTWRTTRRHVLAGEERLSVRWDTASDDVLFEVRSFSRPRHLFAWAAYPYVIAQQKRFARDASIVMERACKS